MIWLTSSMSLCGDRRSQTEGAQPVTVVKTCHQSFLSLGVENIFSVSPSSWTETNRGLLSASCHSSVHLQKDQATKAAAKQQIDGLMDRPVLGPVSFRTCFRTGRKTGLRTGLRTRSFRSTRQRPCSLVRHHSLSSQAASVDTNKQRVICARQPVGTCPPHQPVVASLQLQRPVHSPSLHAQWLNFGKDLQPSEQSGLHRSLMCRSCWFCCWSCYYCCRSYCFCCRCCCCYSCCCRCVVAIVPVIVAVVINEV